MVNVAKLRGKIVEKGYTIHKLADEIGVNKSTLYRKISANGDDFTIGEVRKIFETLDLTNIEAQEIFFDFIVA